MTAATRTRAAPRHATRRATMPTALEAHRSVARRGTPLPSTVTRVPPRSGPSGGANALAPARRGSRSCRAAHSAPYARQLHRPPSPSTDAVATRSARRRAAAAAPADRHRRLAKRAPIAPPRHTRPRARVTTVAAAPPDRSTARTSEHDAPSPAQAHAARRVLAPVGAHLDAASTGRRRRRVAHTSADSLTYAPTPPSRPERQSSAPAPPPPTRSRRPAPSAACRPPRDASRPHRRYRPPPHGT